ncbi:PDDEXK nuclease domain-containing protein [Legionella nagasakiensis]|uniref:PDDEXK nuclease domain-containing protein n=1 Tax=Legionella nagasakiensis TaxID=535290 RepID=UPI001055BEBE|nr:PDDEXK nuclease domain-containing protein [Legionella nagasakiensis]
MSNLIPTNVELLTSIRTILSEARTHLQNTVNTTMVQTYWHIGRVIVEHEQHGEKRADYGLQLLKELSRQLKSEFGKGFDERNLRNMRAFYMAYPKWNAVRTELSWTHYRTLLRIENPSARDWYLKECIEQNWSTRALERQISTLYYERLLSSKDKQSVLDEAEAKTQPLQTNPKEYLRDPYVLDFLNLPYSSILETNIEQALMNNLQQFLLELGKGFAFVARQQRISTKDEDFYIDLVFYNFKLKCFLLIDLKLGKLTHQDVGQMDTYVRIYDEQRKTSDDNPTIGLILCSQKSEAVAKYSVLSESKQLFASKYLPYLPSEEELRKELERERALLNQLPDAQQK